MASSGASSSASAPATSSELRASTEEPGACTGGAKEEAWLAEDPWCQGAASTNAAKFPASGQPNKSAKMSIEIASRSFCVRAVERDALPRGGLGSWESREIRHDDVYKTNLWSKVVGKKMR